MPSGNLVAILFHTRGLQLRPELDLFAQEHRVYASLRVRSYQNVVTSS